MHSASVGSLLFKDLAEYYDKLERVSSRLEMIKILGEMLKELDKNEIADVIYMTQGVLAPPFESVEFGIAEKYMEEAIAIASGRSKEAVHSYYKNKGDLGIVAEELMASTKLKRMGQRQYTSREVYDVMRKIAGTSGEGSKSTKIKELAGMLASTTPLGARYIARYPLGQLRLGLGDATILEALSVMATGTRDVKDRLEAAYNMCSDMGLVASTLKEHGMEAIDKFKVTLFKPIRPALAERLPTSEEIIKRMGGKCAVEQKYDGFRCQIHKDGKKVRIYSRRLEETTDMLPDVVEAVRSEVSAERAIFEGEALAFNESTNEFFPFQETIQRKRKHGVADKALEMPLHLFAFDVMYLDGKDYLSKPYKERREALEGMLKNPSRIRPSTMILTDSPKKLDEFFEESIENGLEGIVAKDLAAPYIAGARKFSWIKLKRSYRGELSDTLDLVVVGYYLGRGSRAEFKFGGLLCATYNEKNDTFETVSRIGSGFTEEQMKELRESLNKIRVAKKPVRVDAVIEPDFWVDLKYVVTVKADEITRSPTHTCGRKKLKDGTEVGYALRFPRLVGPEAIRSDKSPEDATTTKEIEELYSQQKKVGLKE